MRIQRDGTGWLRIYDGPVAPAREDLVLQAPAGGPVRATNFRYRVYTPALEATGFAGLTFHRLRCRGPNAGHMMREVGVPLEVIQRRLGRASIRTTEDIYGTLPEKVDRAAADQLDAMFKASRNGRKIRSAGRNRRDCAARLSPLVAHPCPTAPEFLVGQLWDGGAKQGVVQSRNRPA